MSRCRTLLLVVGLLAVLAGGCSGGEQEGRSKNGPDTPSATTPGRPLAGRVVVLDPGHQLGNAHLLDEINAPVDAGGFEKECNTTGTSTDDGYPEATFVWEVAQVARRELRRLGARVVLTRATNGDELWGPCVDERGRAGNPGERGPTAALKLSLHADGVEEVGPNGFHVIRPGLLPGYTDDIAAPSRTLARTVRDALQQAGFAPSSYRGRNGIDVRTDLGTLNLSDMPTVMVELGNMRDADEAAVMTSRQGRARYARALVLAVRTHLAG